MKQLLIRLALTLSIIAGVSLPVVVGGSTVAFAATASSAVCEGIDAAGGGSGCGTKKTAAECKADPTQAGCEAAATVNSTVTNVINIFSWVAGVASVIMVMLGGFWYITSNGDATKAAKGRTTILYAIVGLIIVALAQVIVKFVIGSLV